MNTNFKNNDQKLVTFLEDSLELFEGDNVVTLYSLINVFQKAELKYGVTTKLSLVKKIKKGETDFKLNYEKGLNSYFEKLKGLDLAN
jgi:hypothetical protein